MRNEATCRDIGAGEGENVHSTWPADRVIIAETGGADSMTRVKRQGKEMHRRGKLVWEGEDGGNGAKALSLNPRLQYGRGHTELASALFDRAEP
jgi:hypothetical protein